MNTVSLDTPSVTQYALGELPSDEAALLRMTHGTPGSRQALAEEAEQTRELGQLLQAAFRQHTPAKEELRLTAAQRAKLLEALEHPPEKLSRQDSKSISQFQRERSSKRQSDFALGLKAAAWTAGAAAAIAALLFLVQTPADSVSGGKETATADGSADMTTGKFKVHAPKESPSILKQERIANKMPESLRQPSGTPTPVLPELRPESPRLTSDQKEAPPSIPGLENLPAQRGPAPVKPEEANKNKSFAAPK